MMFFSAFAIFFFILQSNQCFAATCTQDQTAIYVETKAFQRNPTLFTVSGVSWSSCVDICNSNQRPTGGTFDCDGFNLVSAGVCEFFESSPSASDLQVPKPDTTVYGKSCIDASHITCLSGFSKRPGTVLAGFARDVVSDVTLDECLQTCLDAEFLYGYACLSVMYYYEAQQQECILNSANAGGYPDLVSTVPEKVDYYDHSCNGTYSEWSSWGACFQNERVRTRTCSKQGTCLGRNEETEPCGTTPGFSSTGGGASSTTAGPTTPPTTTIRATSASTIATTSTLRTVPTTRAATTQYTTIFRRSTTRCSKSSGSGGSSHGKRPGGKGGNYGYGSYYGKETNVFQPCANYQGRQYIDCIYRQSDERRKQQQNPENGSRPSKSGKGGKGSRRRRD